MRKLTAYVLLLICATIYIVSSSSDLMKKVDYLRYSSSSLFGSDLYTYGDLFGLSRLPDYKVKVSQNSEVEKVEFTRCEPDAINLYALGDSYLWSFLSSDTLYCGVDRFLLARSNYREKLAISLDSSKVNVLLLEFSERNFRTMFYDSYIQDFVTVRSNVNAVEYPASGSAFTRARDFLFNGSIENNLLNNIWNYRIFTPIKEMKAQINYKLFNRVDRDVHVSSNGERLFFNPTIDRSLVVSSFNPIADDEIKLIISSLNKAYDRYKSFGFDEVYLAIIPNPVTVLEPTYNGFIHNNLIPRIQNSPELKMPHVDIYNDFKITKYDIYYHTDTHWNFTGATMWLNKFNESLSALCVSTDEKR